MGLVACEVVRPKPESLESVYKGKILELVFRQKLKNTIFTQIML